jgi:hypothetical protein
LIEVHYSNVITLDRVIRARQASQKRAQKNAARADAIAKRTAAVTAKSKSRLERERARRDAEIAEELFGGGFHGS